MNITEIKERVSIVDFLSKHGFEPHHQKSGEHVYLSPIRDSDTDASFFVNDKAGKWFDHGMAVGGNIIDLALRIFNSPSVKDVVRKISGIYEGSILPSMNQREAYRGPVINKDAPNYTIKTFKPIGTNPAILEYLNERGLKQEVASNLFKEIYYSIHKDGNQEGGNKNYFGLAWENNSGSWEVRNPYFKGCLGHKDITSFNIDPASYNDRVAVFEGMTDYASWLQENGDRTKAPVVILNSLAMLKKASAIISEYKVPYLFLDNDSSGRESTKELKKQFPNAVDQSAIYKDHKDYNEWQVSIKKGLVIKR